MVAVVGNPNAGKTTLFNALTGSHQKVGNYPGVTVERVSGVLRLPSGTVDCVDVPGMYSLKPQSEDERVAAASALGLEGEPRPDLLVVVMDASNLERNLYLFSQLAEASIPTLVALTMVDRLERRGEDVDFARLTNQLGVDIVPVVGHREFGLAELKAAIDRNLASPRVPEIRLGPPDSREFQAAALRERVARLGSDMTVAEIRAELHETTDTFRNFLEEHPELSEDFASAKASPEAPPQRDAEARYGWAAVVQRAVILQSKGAQKRSRTDRIDALLTHRVFGLMVFIVVMYGVFQSIYTFAKPLMDGIGSGFDAIKNFVSPHLAGVPLLQSLVVDGILTGVGSMLQFLPQILILFFFIALLEGTGYLARAAFLMDRLLGWCGLNGRAFIPLLSSFACAIPGIMAARVMPDPKSRLATILVSPLMSCSARLPVYMLLISAFIEPQFPKATAGFWSGFTLFAMHLVGLFVAIPIVWFLNRKVLKGTRLPFLLELPPYQWPKARDVYLAMVFRAKVFVKTAGSIIVVMSVIIWALSSFPKVSPAQKAQILATSGKEGPKMVREAELEGSALGQFGHAIEPVFRPAGFDWRISTSILAAFPARENVVASLGIIFALGDEVDEKDKGLQNSLKNAKWKDGRPLFTPWTAVGLMVFFALCAQCMATLATVRRETNSWKWPTFMFVYMTLLAYLAAVGIYQLGRAFGQA